MSNAEDVQSYLSGIEESKREAFRNLFETIHHSIPGGFELNLDGLMGWVVPHSIYSDGYHVDPNLPVPFINIGAQRRHIALYHMGLYADPELLEWFQTEYPKHSKTKLNMGKSCVRFTNPKKIPLELIAELSRRVSVADWITVYEKSVKPS